MLYLLIEFANDVERYEIDVAEWVKITHFFLQRSQCNKKKNQSHPLIQYSKLEWTSAIAVTSHTYTVWACEIHQAVSHNMAWLQC